MFASANAVFEGNAAKNFSKVGVVVAGYDKEVNFLSPARRGLPKFGNAPYSIPLSSKAYGI
jgi:hypothetical protein